MLELYVVRLPSRTLGQDLTFVSFPSVQINVVCI